MALLFEFSFYSGLIFIAFALIWITVKLFKRDWSHLAKPIAALLIGLALVTGPAIVSRRLEVDLGPRVVMVNEERHVSLTGWDGTSYELLRSYPDTVVLQMANPDVDDQTLDHLTNMKSLRELDLNDTSITDNGLMKLTELPSLRTLRLRATSITDQGFQEFLSQAQSLTQVDVRQTSVSEEVIERWKESGENRRAFQ
ncbi:Leucine Rich repeats (2 copies) [Rubripirellula obstinata]|uniref:Leucine Rich repeats (2 copies) n=1 Tax=Rubripirellula obstinata TaxID=406547 RepID=A0A5B1CKU9_9BACT|nr:hypothetical protein [Rubripirellula obstinata]KAA1261827.1 Leucine Rich repeats (2 copies) [Rubripirellula obstinata]